MQTSLQQLDPAFNVLSPIFIVILFFLSLILIRKSMLSTNPRILISIVSLVSVGLILGGRPNPVNAFNQFFVNLIPTDPPSIRLLLSALGVFLLLLLSVVLFSRIFCAYACPLGAMQELTSKINFKSTVKQQRKVKYSFDPSDRLLHSIRWIYLVILGITALLFGFSVSQHLDPFNGFQFMEAIAIFTVFFLIMIFMTSFFIYRPWCRGLCPFGAISSLISFSRFRYTRTDDCTDCGLCEKICPSHATNRDDDKAECYYCNRCVDICPHNAIKYRKTAIRTT